MTTNRAYEISALWQHVNYYLWYLLKIKKNLKEGMYGHGTKDPPTSYIVYRLSYIGNNFAMTNITKVGLVSGSLTT